MFNLFRRSKKANNKKTSSNGKILEDEKCSTIEKLENNSISPKNTAVSKFKNKFYLKHEKFNSGTSSDNHSHLKGDICCAIVVANDRDHDHHDDDDDDDDDENNLHKPCTSSGISNQIQENVNFQKEYRKREDEKLKMKKESEKRLKDTEVVLLKKSSRNESVDRQTHNSKIKTFEEANYNLTDTKTLDDVSPTVQLNSVQLQLRKAKFLDQNDINSIGQQNNQSQYHQNHLSDRQKTAAFGKVNTNTTNIATVKVQSDKKSKFNPIEKSREFFNDIIMAKGRNRNRNRKTQQQKQQQQQPEQPLSQSISNTDSLESPFNTKISNATNAFPISEIAINNNNNNNYNNIDSKKLNDESMENLYENGFGDYPIEKMKSKNIIQIIESPLNSGEFENSNKQDEFVENIQFTNESKPKEITENNEQQEKIIEKEKDKTESNSDSSTGENEDNCEDETDTESESESDSESESESETETDLEDAQMRGGREKEHNDENEKSNSISFEDEQTESRRKNAGAKNLKESSEEWHSPTTIGNGNEHLGSSHCRKRDERGTAAIDDDSLLTNLSSDRNASDSSSSDYEEIDDTDDENIAENLTELTEYDRDRYFGNDIKAMGQTSGKTSTKEQEQEPSQLSSTLTAGRSSPTQRTTQPPPFRESIIETNLKFNTKLKSNSYQQSENSECGAAKPIKFESSEKKIIPQITVEDFSDPNSDCSNNSVAFWKFLKLNPNAKLEKSTLHVQNHKNDSDDDEHDDDVKNDGNDDDDNDDNNDDEYHDWQFVDNRIPIENLTTIDEDFETSDIGQNCKSDTNLSTISPDSGIGSNTESFKVLHIDSCDLINDRRTDETILPTQRLQFVRDGNSTDCDENLLLCDDLEEYFTDNHLNVNSNCSLNNSEHRSDNDNLILIESISLPDVVAESHSAECGTSASVKCNSATKLNTLRNQTQNQNANSSSSNSKVHFIPINVERRSMDDSVLPTKSSSSSSSNCFMGNRHFGKGTEITITDEDENEEERKRELVNQESRFNAKLEDAQKLIYNLQTKITELQTKIDELEKELAIKSWNVDRLQGELNATQKEDECVRRRLKILEDDKTHLRQKHFDIEEEFNRKYEDLETQYNEFQVKYRNLQCLASSLHSELTTAQIEESKSRQEANRLRDEKLVEVERLQEALQTANEEKAALDIKWQKEFETLRTQTAVREEQLMVDCEWQLRSMQKTCKDKIDRAERAKSEAIDNAARIETEVEWKLTEINNLKIYQAEVRLLRGLTEDQRTSLTVMAEQIEDLKNDLKMANDELEQQIAEVKKIKHMCDRTLGDKERELIQRIDQVRYDAAEIWETKLITEMTRLKDELESVYIEERRDELDRIQAEHLEELKALTTRFTENEDELQTELAELREKLEKRDREYLEMREKSDNAILQTRMHLQRADRDYQHAMCMEEEKRETAIAALKKDFEIEKAEMEEKFRERLGQVKDEFNKELSMTTQELTEKYRRQLEQQWEQLIAEKDEAIQMIENKYKLRLETADNKLKNIEIDHQRDLKELKSTYDMERTSLDRRDIGNAQEIEQLHRKCRCLTNLFEEMRMRYERRDPRQEDLREISELRSRCDSQEHDLCVLTERLRDMQIQMEEMSSADQQQQQQQPQQQTATMVNGKARKIRKPPPKTIPTNCDVIYEENEERDSPPPKSKVIGGNENVNNNEDEEEDEDENDDDDEDEEEDEDNENGNSEDEEDTNSGLDNTSNYNSSTNGIPIQIVMGTQGS